MFTPALKLSVLLGEKLEKWQELLELTYKGHPLAKIKTMMLTYFDLEKAKKTRLMPIVTILLASAG